MNWINSKRGHSKVQELEKRRQELFEKRRKTKENAISCETLEFENTKRQAIKGGFDLFRDSASSSASSSDRRNLLIPNQNDGGDWNVEKESPKPASIQKGKSLRQDAEFPCISWKDYPKPIACLLRAREKDVPTKKMRKKKKRTRDVKHFVSLSQDGKNEAAKEEKETRSTHNSVIQ